MRTVLQSDSPYQWSTYNPKIRRRAWLFVLIIQLCLLFVLFYFGFVTPLPLPGEEGVLVSFGTEQSGQNTEWQAAQPVVPTQTYTPTPQATDTPLTQDFEDAPEVPIPERPKPKKDTPEKVKPPKRQETPSVQPPPQPQQPPVEEPPRPAVNQQALFPGRAVASNPTQSGAGTGGAPGNQGRPDGAGSVAGVGDGNGAGTGSGQGAGTGGSGIGYNVGSRKALALPPPEYPGQKNGRVVVKVWVNKEGKVTKAQAGEKGSTLYDKSFLSASEQAALQAHFDVAADAPEQQVGTITYVFKLKQ